MSQINANGSQQNKKQQRDMSEHEAGLFGGDLSHYPIIGGLLGGVRRSTVGCQNRR